MIKSHPESSPGYAGDAVQWAFEHAAKGDAHSRRHMRAFAEQAKRSHELTAAGIVDDDARTEFDSTFARDIDLLDQAIAIFDAQDARDGIDTRQPRTTWTRDCMDMLKMEVPGKAIHVPVKGLSVTNVKSVDERTKTGTIVGVDVLLRGHASDKSLILASGTTQELTDCVTRKGHGYLRALRGAPNRDDWKIGENHRPFLVVLGVNPWRDQKADISVNEAWRVRQSGIPDEFL